MTRPPEQTLMRPAERDRETRRALGAFYTSDALARSVTAKALGFWGGSGVPSSLDPACGDGAFLLALEELGVAGSGDGAARCGMDVDPAAIAAARVRLGDAPDLVLADGLDPTVFPGRRFDLVLGNPPFGLPRDDARAWGLAAKRTDSYACFLAMGLRRLAPGGVLGFITADTWLSIRSHGALRDLLLPHLLAVDLLPPGAFDATVGTCAVYLRADPVRGPIAVTDLAGRRYAIGRDTVASLPGHTLFVGRPGLADLLAAGTVRPEEVAPGHAAPVRTLRRGERDIRLVRLGDIAATPHGISTGQNARYVRAVPGISGRYLPLEPRMAMPPGRLESLTEAEKRGGVAGDWEDGTGCYVPFDKGAAADAGAGWLPNYFVPCGYYLNWAEGALADMRRNPGFAWKNSRYFFRRGLTFSVSGAYAPTFRLGAGGVFEAKSSGLFCDVLPPELLLAILCSRVARYLFKVFIKHSVDTSGADVARFPLVLPDPAVRDRMIALVGQIIAAQRRDPAYPYQHREQPELDALAARAYGLSDEEVAEIDAWFAARYSKLAAAQSRR
ncbi:MAG: hypothetical protein FJZ01_00650 [Candidatus Sericytochromatia bacterium]|nr:hypothetical protein [Candidatus Tanganyikabacteria bacterium]